MYGEGGEANEASVELGMHAMPQVSEYQGVRLEDMLNWHHILSSSRMSAVSNYCQGDKM